MAIEVDESLREPLIVLMAGLKLKGLTRMAAIRIARHEHGFRIRDARDASLWFVWKDQAATGGTQ